MGTTMREILEEHAGGMRDGYRFRGVLPGGASTDFLVEEHLDVPMDFDSVQKAGSRLGTGTMIVLDDQTCPVGMVRNLEALLRAGVVRLVHAVLGGLPWVAQTAAGHGRRAAATARRSRAAAAARAAACARPHLSARSRPARSSRCRAR